MSGSATALRSVLERSEERRFRKVGLLGAVHAEFVKLSRMRSVYLMAGAGILLFIFVSAVLLAGPHQRDFVHSDPHGFWNRQLDVYIALFQTGSGIFLLITAARLAAQEYSLGTIRVVLARGESRVQFWAAKLIVLALLGLALLVGFSILALIGTLLTYNVLAGSTRALTSLPTNAWIDLRAAFEAQLVSLSVTLLVATAAGFIGRSLGFGLGAALALFPADNFGTIVMTLLTRLTGNNAYSWATAYFLGPNLNVLPNRLEPDRATTQVFAAPLVLAHLDATHTLVVIAVWALLLLAVPLALLLRRDVLQ